LNDESFLRDSVIELEIRNELLVEKIADLRTALKKLEKKYRLFRNEHLDCKKKIFIYR
jgi:hypothetical protein